MRINLDEPVPDKPEQAAEVVPEPETEDGEASDADATDEFVIHRDESWRRRRRSAPRALTPAEQRAITAALVVVIVIALVSFGLYINSLRRPPIRFPEGTPIAKPAPQAPRRAQVRTPQAPPRAASPPVYQGPPPRGSEPLSEPAGSDTSEPTEGIH